MANKVKYDKRIKRLSRGNPHPASHDSTWDDSFAELDAELYDAMTERGHDLEWGAASDFLYDAIEHDDLGAYMTFDDLLAMFSEWLEN